MQLELQDKVVLITGGSKGIGLACARAFLNEGARVAIAARNQDSLYLAVKTFSSEGYKVHAERINLNNISEVKSGVNRIEDSLGQINVLVNSAGSSKHHDPMSYDSERWIQGIEDKFIPTMQIIDTVIPRMAHNGGGAVINIIGVGGKVAMPSHMAGGAANAALILVTASLAKVWGPSGVRINAINPGPNETDRLKASLKVKAQTSNISVEQQRFKSVSNIPLGRFGCPDDVASLALFLASARASYITGAIIPVDGGAYATP